MWTNSLDFFIDFVWDPFFAPGTVLIPVKLAVIAILMQHCVLVYQFGRILSLMSRISTDSATFVGDAGVRFVGVNPDATLYSITCIGINSRQLPVETLAP